VVELVVVIAVVEVVAVVMFGIVVIPGASGYWIVVVELLIMAPMITV
jgi:hypothetical protein